MAISQDAAVTWEGLRRIRNCLPEIAASGLRPPRNDTGRRHSQVCHCRLRRSRGNLAGCSRNMGRPPANSQLPSRDCRVGLAPLLAMTREEGTPKFVIARLRRSRGNLAGPAGTRESPRRIRNCLPEIAASGLRPPRNDTGRRHSQVCHCEAPQEPWQSRSTGRNTGKPPANSQVRSRDRRPRRFIFPAAKNQGQAIGLPLCFVLLQLRVAHEDGRELCAGGIAGRLEAAVLAVDDARADAPAQRVNGP